MFIELIVPDIVMGAGNTAATGTDKTSDVRNLEYGGRTLRKLTSKLGISDRE